MHQISIELDGATIAGRLPLIPTRFRVVRAHTAAQGLIYDEETDDWTRDEEGNIKTDPDPDAAGCVYAACLGLCWAADEPATPALEPLRRFGHDLVRYGEAVMAELLARGIQLTEISMAGERVYNHIADSIPTRRDLEEAATPSAARGETSTGDSSGPV